MKVITRSARIEKHALMILNELFPLQFFINLGPRQDRRQEVEFLFEERCLEVERVAAINKKWVKNARGFRDKGRYACGLSKRIAIRRAKFRGEDGLLLFEDDLVFHPDFDERVEGLELPEDWELFFLGGQHEERPLVVRPGIVRATNIVDNHAIGIRGSSLDRVLAKLKARGKGFEGVWAEASDRLIAELCSEIPVYAAYPNLVWQAETSSDLNGRRGFSNYHRDGRQKHHKEAVEGLEWEMAHPGESWADYKEGSFQAEAHRRSEQESRLEVLRRLEISSAPGDTTSEETENDSIDLQNGSPFVECVVVAWRRENLRLIIDALREQTVACRVTVITSGRMANGEPVPEETLALADRVYRTSQEYGAFNRYFASFVLEGRYLYFLDDDMLPGSRVVEHFLREARKIGDFGVLGQLGRRFNNGEYVATEISRSSRIEPVDVVVRSYFVPRKYLPAVLESMTQLKIAPSSDIEDDLLLAWTMARLNKGLYLTSMDDDSDTLVNQEELSALDARSERGSHYRIRQMFVRRYWEEAWMVETKLARLAAPEVTHRKYLQYTGLSIKVGISHQMSNLTAMIREAFLTNRSLILPQFTLLGSHTDGQDIHTYLEEYLDIKNVKVNGVPIEVTPPRTDLEGLVPHNALPGTDIRNCEDDLIVKSLNGVGLVRLCLPESYSTLETTNVTISNHPKLRAAAKNAATRLGHDVAWVHVRRGDLLHKTEGGTTPQHIAEVVGKLSPAVKKIFIATNEHNLAHFEPLRGQFEVSFYTNFKEFVLLRLEDNYKLFLAEKELAKYCTFRISTFKTKSRFYDGFLCEEEGSQ